MSLTEQLLVRALVAMHWQSPYPHRLVRWGTTLHDRFMLPHFVREDFDDVVADLGHAGFPFEADWFRPHFEFRFPLVGTIQVHSLELELRRALEPWHVLGEQGAMGATARYVDSSLERLQVRVRNLTDSRHPTIGVHAPLIFDVFDTWSDRAVGGCTYHVSHLGGRWFDTRPRNSLEAEGRRKARFFPFGHSPGSGVVEPEPTNPLFPLTLDLRR